MAAKAAPTMVRAKVAASWESGPSQSARRGDTHRLSAKVADCIVGQALSFNRAKERFAVWRQLQKQSRAELWPKGLARRRFLVWRRNHAASAPGGVGKATTCLRSSGVDAAIAADTDELPAHPCAGGNVCGDGGTSGGGASVPVTSHKRRRVVLTPKAQTGTAKGIVPASVNSSHGASVGVIVRCDNASSTTPSSDNSGGGSVACGGNGAVGATSTVSFARSNEGANDSQSAAVRNRSMIASSAGDGHRRATGMSSGVIASERVTTPRMLGHLKDCDFTCGVDVRRTASLPSFRPALLDFRGRTSAAKMAALCQKLDGVESISSSSSSCCSSSEDENWVTVNVEEAKRRLNDTLRAERRQNRAKEARKAAKKEAKRLEKKIKKTLKKEKKKEKKRAKKEKKKLKILK
eukprot:TRINITY_DN40757_c0_g1_i1.p1 TRINITY_DN40757_c0_g1~~TRINITY_DN40757_c0_g1_i1.p1  ORF type:complete len:433 (+),score=103.74 TRINITY_DN40757_c0_g1_i1:81-1301(+)